MSFYLDSILYSGECVEIKYKKILSIPNTDFMIIIIIIDVW